MNLNFALIKKDVETFIKMHLYNAVKKGAYNYTTFGKVVEDLIADGLEYFFHNKFNIPYTQFKRAKDKNEFPDFLIMNNYAIDFKAAISSQQPENDLGTINSWPEKISTFGSENIYFLFVKYAVNSSTIIIEDVYFDKFYKFIGKSKGDILKYREKDGNLRPKSWECFDNNYSYWETYNDFKEAFYRTKSVRARKLVEKHFQDMTDEDKAAFIEKYRKK